ncbi:UNVERIFIED_CONTAM: hypothetical protein FKN15_075023 [Acipenser sinensis]
MEWQHTICSFSGLKNPNVTHINPGAGAMEPALTPGSTPAHEHDLREHQLHRINYYRTLELQDGAREAV